MGIVEFTSGTWSRIVLLMDGMEWNGMEWNGIALSYNELIAY
jgi:hypothetical protein